MILIATQGDKKLNNKYKQPIIKHFLSFDSLDKEGILYLLSRINEFASLIANKNYQAPATNKTMMNLFYEPSTRAQYSFIMAAHYLGIYCMNPNMLTLSDQKGESLVDTIQTFEAIGVDLFVIRHKESHTPSFLAGELNTNCNIINAGDGSNQHPSQTLIDLATIQQSLNRLSDLTITIIGDIRHSRVAHSFIDAASILQMGQINLVGPQHFLPETIDSNIPVTCYTDLEAGIANADVVMALRVQKERIDTDELPDLTSFSNQYCLTPERMLLANPNAIVLHPGPIIRGMEIDSAVADGPQSKILCQVQNSTPARMAILDLLLNYNATFHSNSAHTV